MKILGLGHYSRTGKDSLAEMVQNELSVIAPDLKVERVSFAAKLKDICHQLYAWDGLREASFYETEYGAPFRDVPLSNVGMTPVEVWVAMGTPAIRENVYQDTWIDYVLRTPTECDVMIITDVRFPNEAKKIKEMGGTLVKLVREDFGPRDTVADLALEGWDGWDYIAGPTLEELRDVHCRVLSQALARSWDLPLQQSAEERAEILSKEREPTRNVVFDSYYGVRGVGTVD